VRRRFFVEKFDHDTAVMRGETAEHLGRVLRAETGQLYELSDGSTVCLARVENVALTKHGESRIDFALLEPIATREPRLALDLLIALVKFDRFEWCLEKATELGVNEIIPLAAARTDKALIDAAGKRRERWQRILVESAQQARRLKPTSLAKVVRPTHAFGAAKADRKIILSERADAPPIREILQSVDAINSAALAIGPEGGWTDEEFEAARGAGFAEASLGENILRTETAVIAAVSVIRFCVK
jgi:16S rRNA (uracil1498-N3)-methyltransferase